MVVTIKQRDAKIRSRNSISQFETNDLCAHSGRGICNPFFWPIYQVIPEYYGIATVAPPISFPFASFPISIILAPIRESTSIKTEWIIILFYSILTRDNLSKKLIPMTWLRLLFFVTLSFGMCVPVFPQQHVDLPKLKLNFPRQQRHCFYNACKLLLWYNTYPSS